MGLLDGIEKLITEHGSAVILRERIALANDKYSALQSENSTLKSQNAIFKSENEALKLDNEKFHKQRQDDLHSKNTPAYKMVYGCMKFEGDNNLYCPGCFHNKNKKVPTSRKGTKYQFCAACKTDISSG
jgi:hypothetical protein